MFLQRRLTGEKKMLDKNRENYYQVVQDSNNDLIFYFLYRCNDNTSCYNGGFYIGKIEIPSDYPMKPGDFYMLTPSGRFDINKKICLTNSGYHSSEWRPIWNLQNMVIGMISIFMDDSTHGISHIKLSDKERKEMANESIAYNLTYHYDIFVKFDRFVKETGDIRTNDEIDTLAKNKQIVREVISKEITNVNNDSSKVSKDNDLQSNSIIEKSISSANQDLPEGNINELIKWVDGIKDITLQSFDITYFTKFVF